MGLGYGSGIGQSKRETWRIKREGLDIVREQEKGTRCSKRDELNTVRDRDFAQ